LTCSDNDDSDDSRKRKRDDEESSDGLELMDQDNGSILDDTLQGKKPRSYARSHLMEDLVLDSDSDMESIARYSDHSDNSDHCETMEYDHNDCLADVMESDADIIARLQAENAELRYRLDHQMSLYIPQGFQPEYYYTNGEMRHITLVRPSASAGLTMDDLNCDHMDIHHNSDSDNDNDDLMDYDNDSQ
jgi:hypothetical protein